jgi:hypothetical protein
MFNKKIWNKEWYLKNKEELKIKHKKYYLKNKEKMLKQSKEYYKKWSEKNKDKIKIKTKIYIINNKEQINKKVKIYRRTIDGYTSILWHSLNTRTINGKNPNWKNNNIKKNYLNKGIRLEITREQLLQKITEDWIKINNMWNNNKKPSIDRIDSNGHYELGNIQFISMKENIHKTNKYVQFLMKNYPDFYNETYKEFTIYQDISVT